MKQKPLPPEVSLGQLLDIMAGKKPKTVPRENRAKPLNSWWHVNQKNPKFSGVRRTWMSAANLAFERRMALYRVSHAKILADRAREKALADKREKKRAKGRKYYLGRISGSAPIPKIAKRVVSQPQSHNPSRTDLQPLTRQALQEQAQALLAHVRRRNHERGRRLGLLRANFRLRDRRAAELQAEHEY